MISLSDDKKTETEKKTSWGVNFSIILIVFFSLATLISIWSDGDTPNTKNALAKGQERMAEVKSAWKICLFPAGAKVTDYCIPIKQKEPVKGNRLYLTALTRENHILTLEGEFNSDKGEYDINWSEPGRFGPAVLGLMSDGHYVGKWAQLLSPDPKEREGGFLQLIKQ